MQASLYAVTTDLVHLICNTLGPFWQLDHLVSGQFGQTSLDISCHICRVRFSRILHNLLEISQARGLLYSHGWASVLSNSCIRLSVWLVFLSLLVFI